jgi:futalosine hydrolase
MKILITAATELELIGLKNKLNVGVFSSLDFLVTGVGMINTTFELTKHLSQHHYDLVIQIGIAGAFDRSIALGEVVWIRTDMFSEMGAEDNDDFLSLIQLGLQEPEEFPYKWAELKPTIAKEINTLQSLKQVRAITVNKVHGNASSIMQTLIRLNPQTESMEGAAFFHVCMKLNVPCLQIRSISNYVEVRNKENWNIPLALQSLHTSSHNLISELFQ